MTTGNTPHLVVLMPIDQTQMHDKTCASGFLKSGSSKGKKKLMCGEGN